MVKKVTKKIKRIICMILAFVMVFSSTSLSNIVYANSESPVTVKVNFTSQAAGGFLHYPMYGVEVTSDTAEKYGYTDSIEGGVSALDVLVKAHEIIFEDAFTSETKDDCLVVNESGFVTKIFGEATTSNGFIYNGIFPHDGTVSEYGGYNGTTVTTQEVKDGDSLDFFIYQDSSNWSDKIIWYGINNEISNAYKILPSKDYSLNVAGSMYMTGYLNKDAGAMHESGSSISGISVYTINMETGALSENPIGTTDEQGNVTINFEASGEYYITAKGTDSTGSPVIMNPIKLTVVSDAASITVPSDAALFVGSKTKHFVKFDEIEPLYKSNNSEDTTTYWYDLKNNSQYNYRVSGENYITYGDVFKKTAGMEIVVPKEKLQPEGKSKTTVDKDVSSNSKYNVADIYLNINPQGYLKLANVNDTYQLVNLRNWEAINSITGNYFIEPDFHYTVINENGVEDSSVVNVDSEGKITAVGNGTAIVLATYDSMTFPSAVGGEFFGAIWPENTGVFVVSVGAEDSGIDTNMTLNEGKNPDGSASKLAEDALDSEHDVIYFVGESGEYTFTPSTEGCTVSVANPTITDKMSYSGFVPVSKKADGSFSIPLKTGRNIVKLEKEGKFEYQVITAKKVSYTVNGGATVHPGDDISIVFDTIYHPANKLAGVYNMSAFILYEKVDGYSDELIGSISNQYQFAATPAAQTVSNILQKKVNSWGMASYSKKASLKVPDDYDTDTFTLDEGSIFVTGYGDPYGNHRGISLETGKAPNLNATTKNGYLGKLPKIEIPVVTTVNKIILDTENVKKDYLEGESFDPTGLKVKIEYEDGVCVETADYSISPEELTIDTKEVVVTCKGSTAKIPVNRTARTLLNLEIETMPDVTSYKKGDVFNPNGLVVKAVYDNGQKEIITDYSISPKRALDTTDTKIIIEYKGKTINVPVEVSANENNESEFVNVKFTLLGDDIHGETGTSHTLSSGNLKTWIDTTSINVKKNSKVVDVINTALGINGIPYSNPSGNYITNVNGLSEFGNGSNSGWMYTLNGVFPNLGIDEQVVKGGDEIVLFFTDDYSKENYDVAAPSEPVDSGISVNKAYSSTRELIEKSIETPAIGSEWMIIGAARSKMNLTESFKKAYYEEAAKYISKTVNDKGQLSKTKSTENSKMILALTSLGIDPTDVEGINLLSPLADMDYVVKQGINGPIWALIALDSNKYSVPQAKGMVNNVTTREVLIDYIINKQFEDGGFALSGKASDADITAMAVQALAPYYSSNVKARNSIDKALACLSAMQCEDGSYKSMGIKNAESCSQVIVALTSLGIDPTKDTRFIKNGKTVLDALCYFAVDNGGFKHIADGQTNGMATEQGFYALVSYDRLVNNKTSLYDMKDVDKYEKPEDKPVVDTATEEKIENIVEKVDSIISEEVAVGSEEKLVDSVVEATKAYENLSDEEKALVSDEVKEKIAKAQEKAGEINHKSGDVKVEGVKWNFKVTAKPVETITVETRALKKSAENNLKDGTVLLTYDISLTDVLSNTKVEPGEDGITITMPIPDEAKDYDHIIVAHLRADGVIEYVKAQKADGMITFKLDSLSPVAIVGYNGTEVEANFNDTTTAPKTNDLNGFNAFAYTGLMILCVGTVVVVLRKRKTNKL